MVDIVITYLDDNKKWRKEYNYWKNYEIDSGIIEETSKQAFGEERTRNWDFLKYWFRSIEKNCTWVNKVFFIVQNETHIPDWLNTNYEKLRVVYHDEYIPEELLPTFNSTTIGLFISNIKDLSDNYVYCDDDMFFMNPIKEDRFFKDNIAQHENNRIPYGYFFDGDEYLHILNNCFDFEKRYMKEEIKYHFYHLPVARKKTSEQKILKDNYKDIIEYQGKSKFRYKTNLDPNIFPNILKLTNDCYIGEKGHVYSNCGYVALKDGVDLEPYKEKDIVCFNDTDLATPDFDKVKNNLDNFLESIFNKKSKYER